MSTPESDPAAVFGQPVSPMDRLRDSVATQPQAAPGPFRSVRTGWAAGRRVDRDGRDDGEYFGGCGGAGGGAAVGSCGVRRCCGIYF